MKKVVKMVKIKLSARTVADFVFFLADNTKFIILCFIGNSGKNLI